jgi:hypothetical protein
MGAPDEALPTPAKRRCATATEKHLRAWRTRSVLSP